MKRKPFGGEAPLDLGDLHYAFVHSGRAALRLLLASGLGRKKLLIPDFLCGVIIDVLKEGKTPFSTYAVNADLSVQWPMVAKQSFDVLYVINYFGQQTKVPAGIIKGKGLIVDDVFAPRINTLPVKGSWAVFNSLRKVTALAEGAGVISTMKLNTAGIKNPLAEFADLKYSAKQLKADYLHKAKGSETGFINKFRQAEHLLDTDRSIHLPSAVTIGLLPGIIADLPTEQAIRRRQYDILDKALGRWSIKIRPAYYSFYVLSIDRRDEVRALLAKQGIFLPAHWPLPEGSGLSNELYARVLPVPLDSRYSIAEIRRVALAIKESICRIQR